jgi:hypothetical protein
MRSNAAMSRSRCLESATPSALALTHGAVRSVDHRAQHHSNRHAEECQQNLAHNRTSSQAANTADQGTITCRVCSQILADQCLLVALRCRSRTSALTVSIRGRADKPRTSTTMARGRIQSSKLSDRRRADRRRGRLQDSPVVLDLLQRAESRMRVAPFRPGWIARHACA